VRFSHSRYSDDVDGNNWSSYARRSEAIRPGSDTEYRQRSYVRLQGTATSGNNLAMRSLLSLLSGSLSQSHSSIGSLFAQLDKFQDYRRLFSEYVSE